MLIDFRKTQEWLVVESCLTPHLIAFLILYQLVYNIPSHFNELIWSEVPKSTLILRYVNVWDL